MILPFELIIAYPLLTLNSYYQTNDNIISYKPYTTTSMDDHSEIKVYEPIWNNIFQEEFNSLNNNE